MPEGGRITLNATQQNVLLAAAETLDDLGAPRNANDIRLVLANADPVQPHSGITDEEILAVWEKSVDYPEEVTHGDAIGFARAMLAFADNQKQR